MPAYPPIPHRPLAAAVAARLVALTNATGWVGQISARTGLPGVDDTPGGPIAKSDTDARVQPYFVLYPGLGNPVAEQDLGDQSVDVDIPVTVTAAAGDVEDLLALVGRIDTLLWRWVPDGLGWFVYDPTTPAWLWAPSPDGYAEATPILAGPLRPIPDAPRQLLLDESVDPSRHYVRLEYALRAHT